MVLVFVEERADELSQQALVFAGGLGEELQAVGFEGSAYAPVAWAQALVENIEQHGPSVVVGPGSDRGNEVLAHVAAQLDQPMAANCISLTPGDPASIVRVRWGGSLLEEGRLHGSPKLVTVAPYSVTADSASVTTDVELVHVDPTGSVAVSERVATASSGVSLADADVVVSGGRGVGSSRGSR